MLLLGATVGSAAAQSVSVGPIAGAPGETVTVPIFISDSPALSGVQVNVAFDTEGAAVIEGAETEGTVAGDLIAAGGFSQQGSTGFVAAAASAVEVTRDQVVALRFTLSDEPVASEATVTVKLSVGDNPPQSQTFELGTVAVAGNVDVTIPTDVLLTDRPDTLALEVGDLTDLGVHGYQFDLVYDPGVLSITDVLREGTLSDVQGSSFISQQVADGRYRVVYAHTAPLSGAGLLLAFGVDVSPNSGVRVRFENVKFVDGEGNLVPVVTRDKTILVSATSNEPGETVPSQFALTGIYPNPFQDRINVRLDLPQPMAVEVTLYDVLGREVRTDRLGTLAAGAGNLLAVNGSGLSAGIYFLRVRATANDGKVHQHVARVVRLK
ncbi:T9SS type A sorting domain-containing protein [Rhodocaloribacter litoris]|uniref:T9SS type A sorting domain-containing protein n=1 Tax=Rhodocaloribacter litoris TaxID=2558931 RepID=UPI001E31A767|nr:cohesin domain-containing protein [Rhodocaloribacter litoris]QXD16699.1 T9SS type A sorting domain-containing protein [Rhodocaloribacter litoris]